MYLSVNLDKMVFCHKHPDYETVAGLVHIELGNNAVSILPVEHPKGFETFTDLEMRLLYQNTTGKKAEGYLRSHVEKSLVELTGWLPFTDAVPGEVLQQARKIPMGDKQFYRYVKGSYTAALLADLFVPEPLRADPAATPQKPQAPVFTPAPAPTPPARGKTATATHVANPQVTAIADDHWLRAGKPVQVMSLLQLRQDITKELIEKLGLDKQTCFVLLTEWQKIKLAK